MKTTYTFLSYFSGIFILNQTYTVYPGGFENVAIDLQTANEIRRITK